jgi:hypothetical protein
LVPVLVLALASVSTAQARAGGEFQVNTALFNEVAAANPFCPRVEELARRGAVAGCGAGNSCPGARVFRDSTSVFVSTTYGLSLYGP